MRRYTPTPLHPVGRRPTFRRLPLALSSRCLSTLPYPSPESTGKSVPSFTDLDAKWQKYWKSLGPYSSERWRLPQKPSDKHSLREEKGKAFVLPMFPYPSGTLHLGHLRNYTISDVLARFKHMDGYQVTHPIGWDAFGLPAENAAIERGIHPETWTMANIEAMKEQLEVMGGRWDWDKEIRTCDPQFYKHTQRIFLKLYEKGLAYQAESMVNYDPVDKTVLANEQVDANGCSWRSGAKVQKVMLKQWFLNIKAFQEPLLEDLELLAHDKRWPERVIAMQKNWLGRSRGTKLWFDVNCIGQNKSYTPVDVFTTRLDTVFAAQYIALSLKHPIVQDLANQDPSLRAFLERAEQLPEDSKEGYLLPGIAAKNPIGKILNWAHDDLPVYAAPYVLSDYGSGAVMGVPGHDSRDHAFWRANAGDKPIERVITMDPSQQPAPLVAGSDDDTPSTEKGFVSKHIPLCGGLESDAATSVLLERFTLLKVPATRTENWRLKDWLISRQRYWGTPIPIVHCKSCGPVPEPNLPVKLPDLPDDAFRGKAGNPLADHESWKNTTCPKCKGPAERETDTMDTFMDSSWYFFRFLDPRNDLTPFDPLKANGGMPVDLYIGGVEHAILHLLYARFISKFLATTGDWPAGKHVKAEPFRRLITQGMVHGQTYSEPHTGRFLRPDEVDLSNPSTPVIKATGEAPLVSFEKMSKSKHNGVDPRATIAKYGADVTRAHMLFQAPVGDVLQWDETKITGVTRWLTRVLKLCAVRFIPPHMMDRFVPPDDLDAPLIQVLRPLCARGTLKVMNHDGESEESNLIAALRHSEQQFWAQTQKIIASVTASYSKTYSLNTIISDLMTLTNTIWDQKHTSDALAHLRYLAVCHLLRMLAPIAPAVAEEGWALLHSITATRISKNMGSSNPLCRGGGPSIFAFPFPKADTRAISLLDTTIDSTIQIDGKVKFTVPIQPLPVRSAPVNDLELAAHVLPQILDTAQGRQWLDKSDGKLWKASTTQSSNAVSPLIPDGWNVVIVKRGKIVNFISPKKKINGKMVVDPNIQAILRARHGDTAELAATQKLRAAVAEEPAPAEEDSRPQSLTREEAIHYNRVNIETSRRLKNAEAVAREEQRWKKLVEGIDSTLLPYYLPHHVYPLKIRQIRRLYEDGYAKVYTDSSPSEASSSGDDSNQSNQASFEQDSEEHSAPEYAGQSVGLPSAAWDAYIIPVPSLIPRSQVIRRLPPADLREKRSRIVEKYNVCFPDDLLTLRPGKPFMYGRLRRSLHFKSRLVIARKYGILLPAQYPQPETEDSATAGKEAPARFEPADTDADTAARNEDAEGCDATGGSSPSLRATLTWDQELECQVLFDRVLQLWEEAIARWAKAAREETGKRGSVLGYRLSRVVGWFVGVGESKGKEYRIGL